MTTFQTPDPDSTDCNPNYGYYRDQKGVTIWGPYTCTMNPGQPSDKLWFTLTNPKCYGGSVSHCNLTYTIKTDRDVSGDDIAIQLWFNNDMDSNHTDHMITRYHSRKHFDGTNYHDITETIDISQWKDANNAFILVPGTSGGSKI